MSQDEAETYQHYRVLRRDDGSLWKLGAGAMGVTYKAIDTNLDAPVALKVINALYTGSDTARERFVREAKAAASLRHRNVANVYHLGHDGQATQMALNAKQPTGGLGRVIATSSARRRRGRRMEV